MNSGMMKHIMRKNPPKSMVEQKKDVQTYNIGSIIKHPKYLQYEKDSAHRCYSLKDYERYMSQEEPFLPENDYDDYIVFLNKQKQREIYEKEMDLYMEWELIQEHRNYIYEHMYFSKYNDLSQEKEDSYIVNDEPDENGDFTPTEYDTPQP